LHAPEEYEIRIVDKSWKGYWNKLGPEEQIVVDDKIMNVLRFKPYESESLEAELKGMRSYNKLESDLRIYYVICYECRKGGFTKVNNCPDCSLVKDNVVKLFAVGSHSIYAELSRERRKRLRKRGK
jgi:hypothetical protein